MHVENLIDPNTSGLQSPAYGGIGYWTATGADLARTTKRAHSGIASIQIVATAESPTAAILYSADSANVFELVEVNKTKLVNANKDVAYRMFLWFYHETVGRTIRAGIQFYDATQTPITQTAAHYDDFTMSFRDWTLASLVIGIDDLPDNARYAAVKIEFLVPSLTDKVDSRLWIDDVVLYQPEDVTTEPIVQRLSRWIPEYMIEEDGNQTNPVNPMLLYLDVASSTLGDVYEYISDFGYETVGNPNYPLATSTLTDPSGYPESGTKDEWLPWLAQLVGMRSTSIDDVSGSGTDWAYLEKFYETWSEWETEVNPNSLSYTTPWSSVSRTNGLVTVVVGSHGFSDGDAFTISGSSETTLNGTYEVADAPSTTDIQFSQSYSIISLQQVTTTVTVTTGVAHNLSVSKTVVINGTNTAFDGTTQTVASVSSTDDFNNVFTFTATSGSASSSNGTVWPSNLASATGTIETSVDLNWSSIEGSNAAILTPPQALAEFIRTGASGIWAGTIEGVKRASRLALEGGFDSTVIIERNLGYLTVTSSELHKLSATEFVEIYSCPYPELSGVYSVDSVINGNSFKVVYAGGYLLTRGWATSKKVEIEKQYWNGDIQAISASSDTVTIQFEEPMPVTSSHDILGLIKITDTGNATFDDPDGFGEFEVGDVTISSDRRSIVFNVAGIGTISEIDETPAKAKLNMSDSSFLLIKTLRPQTTGPEAVLSLASFAKPAGAVITHAYIL